MFNTTNVSVVPRVANSVQIQACSGGIYKSHPKSRIVRVHINSEAADLMLSPIKSSRVQKEVLYNGRKNIVDDKEVVILQVVNAAEGYLFVEYMYKDDYEAENVFFNPDGT